MSRRRSDFQTGDILAARGALTLARALEGATVDRLGPPEWEGLDARFVAPPGGWPGKYGEKLKERFWLDLKSRKLGEDTVPFELGNEYKRKGGAFKRAWGLTGHADYVAFVFCDYRASSLGRASLDVLKTGRGHLILVELEAWRSLWLPTHRGCSRGHTCGSARGWQVRPTGWKKARDGATYRTWNAYAPVEELRKKDVVAAEVDHLVSLDWRPVDARLVAAVKVKVKKVKTGHTWTGLTWGSFRVFVDRLLEGDEELVDLQAPASLPRGRHVLYYASLLSSPGIRALSWEAQFLRLALPCLAELNDPQGLVPADPEAIHAALSPSLRFPRIKWLKRALAELIRHGHVVPVAGRWLEPHNHAAYQSLLSLAELP